MFDGNRYAGPLIYSPPRLAGIYGRWQPAGEYADDQAAVARLRRRPGARGVIHVKSPAWRRRAFPGGKVWRASKGSPAHLDKSESRPSDVRHAVSQRQ